MTPLHSDRPEFDFDYVSARLAEAGMTLLALQVRGLRPAGFRSNMPTPAGTVVDDHRPAPPPPRKITEMDQAMSWVTLIPPEMLTLRRLVLARAMTIMRVDRQGFDRHEALYSWKVLGRWLRCSDHTAKTRWITAIELIVVKLNQPVFCQSAAVQGTRGMAIGALEAAAAQAALQSIDRIRRLEAA